MSGLPLPVGVELDLTVARVSELTSNLTEFENLLSAEAMQAAKDLTVYLEAFEESVQWKIVGMVTNQISANRSKPLPQKLRVVRADKMPIRTAKAALDHAKANNRSMLVLSTEDLNKLLVSSKVNDARLAACIDTMTDEQIKSVYGSAVYKL